MERFQREPATAESLEAFKGELQLFPLFLVSVSDLTVELGKTHVPTFSIFCTVDFIIALTSKLDR